MGSFGQDFSQGLALGSSIYNNAQRESRQDQEQQWKGEDRQRETDERAQLDELGKMMGKWEQGDFSPAIAKANSSGMFGPDRYAAGARMGDDGNIYGQVYHSKDPVNSMQEVNLGKAQDLKNQMVMAHAPPRVLATLGVTQATKQADPEYQQRVQSGALGIQEQRLKVGAMPEKIAQDQAQGRASLDHTIAGTNATNQTVAHQALMSPEQLRAAKAKADSDEWAAKNPQANRVMGTETTYVDDNTSRSRKLYAGDPALQSPPTALAGPQAAQPAQSAAPTSQAAPTGPQGSAAPQQKKLDAAKVKEFLLKAQGDMDKARAMARSEGWSF